MAFPKSGSGTASSSEQGESVMMMMMMMMMLLMIIVMMMLVMVVIVMMMAHERLSMILAQRFQPKSPPVETKVSVKVFSHLLPTWVQIVVFL